MLEALLKKLFVKLEQEPTNDKKSKNGCAIFFKEKILEERFEQYNLISVRGLKDYYDKYVNGKENSSGTVFPRFLKWSVIRLRQIW